MDVYLLHNNRHDVMVSQFLLHFSSTIATPSLSLRPFLPRQSPLLYKLSIIVYLKSQHSLYVLQRTRRHRRWPLHDNRPTTTCSAGTLSPRRPTTGIRSRPQPTARNGSCVSSTTGRLSGSSYYCSPYAASSCPGPIFSSSRPTSPT